MGVRRRGAVMKAKRSIATRDLLAKVQARKQARRPAAVQQRQAAEEAASPLADMRKCLRKPVEQGSCPGIAASVHVAGQLRMLEEIGFADLEERRPMTRNSIVRIYSMTKCVVAAALMQLVEEGQVCLDDQLQDHIPAFADMRVVTEAEDGMPDLTKLVPAKRPITLRHLLTHTSGISSGLATGLDGPRERKARERAWAGIYSPLVRSIDQGEFCDLATWVAALAQAPLHSHPGEYYGYGYSYDILGHIVELKTGTSLARYLRTKIFQPLGMRDTGFDLAGKQASKKWRRLTTLYRYTKSARFGSDGRRPRLVRVDPPKQGGVSRWCVPCKVTSGGGGLSSLEGGLLSTLEDYSKFLLAVLSGGAHPATGVRILSPASAEEMVADQTLKLGAGGQRVPASASPYNSRGLGLSCLGEVQRRTAPSSGGWFDGVPGVRLWGGAASCAFKYDPNRGRPILVLVMTQVLPQEDGRCITSLLHEVRRRVESRDI